MDGRVPLTKKQREAQRHLASLLQDNATLAIKVHANLSKALVCECNSWSAVSQHPPCFMLTLSGKALRVREVHALARFPPLHA